MQPRFELLPITKGYIRIMAPGVRLSHSIMGLLQLQMRILFPFLPAKDIHRFLLLMRTRSFLLSCT